MSTVPILLEWKGQHLWISPERCLFWEEQKMLILSDLHIGKTAHFRKAGIAVPQQVFQEDMHRLYQQIHHFNPDRILITGDLFHSHANIEHDVFARWRESLGPREIILVKGNHEVLDDDAYSNLGLNIVGEKYTIDGFSFTHNMHDQGTDGGQYWFCGHVHPGIKLQGKGKQAIVLPCFHFTFTHCTLPAFSRFSGKHLISPSASDQVYAIVDNGLQKSIISVPYN
jgi:DNA ligase-associated metallophosphoesterase